MDASLFPALVLPALLQVATWLCWSMGALLVLGPAALRKSIRLPARLGIQPVKDEEVDEGARRWFDELDGLLGSQGFRPALNVVATGLPGKNLTRLYLSSGDPSIAVASTVSHAKKEVSLSRSYVEFAVDFQDGTSLLTTSTAADGGIVPHPSASVFRHPSLRNPLALKQRHDAHLHRLMSHGACFRTPEQLPETMEASYARKMEHNVERRRWRRLGDGSYALSYWNALRAVFQHLNPFAEQAWDVRVAIALLLALVPTVGTLLLIAGQLICLPAIQSLAPGLDAGIAWLVVFVPVALLGSVTLGAVLEGRAVSWVVFFHLAENGALSPAGRSLSGNVALLCVLVASVQAAVWASNLVNARRKLV